MDPMEWRVDSRISRFYSPPFSRLASPRSVTWKNKCTQQHLGTQKRALRSSGRAPASFAACLSGPPRFSLPPYIPLSSSFCTPLSVVLLPPSWRARASTRASGVSACTYIRYLSAYIWVPIYRYQMVNERVDARSGRPQLAATQSFVYRGAVCATARTGWPRNVVFFSARRRQREIPRESEGKGGDRVVRAGEWLQQGRNALRT